MTEHVPGTPGDWHPTKPTWSFSDYGEWLDEGTSAVLEDMGTRAIAPEGRSFVSVPVADYDISVVHDRAGHAYRATFGFEEIGHITYRLVGERIALWDTAVLPPYRDHGVAAELIAKALDDIRETGKTVTVICPIVRRMIDHYPQYLDMVDETHPGVRFKNPT
ncbi:MAG TPA: GNAT family N-acetyltransferase [Trebonia sp.]|jgi:predicted GNAT family acetyltransferase